MRLVVFLRGINVVVLCSDGVANVGMTGPDSIAARIAEEAATASTWSPSATGWATTTTT